MTHPIDTPANPAQGVNEARLPATKAYVDRLIRIFNERPTDDTSAVVLVDYARAALTAAIGAGGQAVAQFRKTGCSDWYDGLPDNEDGRGPYETRTLYSHPAPSGQAVAVEPLEWERLSNGNLRALGAFGYRYIVHARSGSFLLHHAGSLSDDSFETEEAAKAAAQADYERRILSALSQPHPADDRVAPTEGVSNKAEEGRQAYKEGQSRDCNPYPRGTTRYWQWSSGWLDERAFRPRPDERVVEALPRPDAVSMASGTICLEYVDRDERDLALDWLEAHGAGAAPAAATAVTGGQ